MAIAGKLIVVVGSSGGIGSGFVVRAIRAGATVVACSRKPPDPELYSPSDSCSPGILKWVPVDLGDEKSVKSAVREIREAAPIIDGLLLAAGAPHGATAQLTRTSDLRHTFEINAFSQFFLLQGLSRSFRAGSSCVVVSSIASDYVQTGNSVYGASKAALERFVVGFAKELASSGVRLNAILPGPVETPMLNNMDSNRLGEMLRDSFRGTAIEPEEVIDLIEFLISDSSRSLTGSFLRLDGGLR